MKVKKSALEVVNGMSEREQLALLKFVLNGLTTLTIKQSVETTCANIIGEKNVKVKQVVIEWEEGGSTNFSNKQEENKKLRQENYDLKVENREYASGCKIKEMCFTCNHTRKLQNELLGADKTIENLKNRIAELDSFLNQNRKERSHLESKVSLLEYNYRQMAEKHEKLCKQIRELV